VPVTGGAIRLSQLAKSFDGVPAVTGIDLDIPAGQFYSLLGASGCGKTTTLRMIAGFEKPDSGRIELDGRDVAGDPPHRRPVNTVFQTYALFPFMTVWDNVAFGLRYQKASRPDTKRRVDAALELVRMGDFAKRRPAQLSGGQQQRVALARALVLEPRVLLLDEPLGALDAQLRKQLQLELRSVQREVGITFVYVTHDQEEALTMSDQIAVLAQGRVEQVGPPQEVYSAPATTFVAGFLGAANIFDADVLEVGDGTAVCSSLGTRLGAAVDASARRGAAWESIGRVRRGSGEGTSALGVPEHKPAERLFTGFEVDIRQPRGRHDAERVAVAAGVLRRDQPILTGDSHA